MIKRLISWCSLFLALAAILGIFWGIDQRWAKASDVKNIEKRLEQKILSDKLDRVQERIWKIEDRYPKGITNKNDLEQYRMLQQEFRKTTEELNKK